MLDSKFNRVYGCWNTLIQSAERKTIENELKSLYLQCKNTTDAFMSYIPNYNGLYGLEKNVCYNQFPNIYILLNIIKLQDEQAYNNFTENHDILNLNEYLDFDVEDSSQIISKFSAIKDYTSFLTHLILRIYDEKDEAKKKAMLESMM